MPIVSHELAYMLTGIKAEDVATKASTHTSATGPGYHSMWMFMSHNDNSFLELEVSRKASNKKKIIFNVGFLKERALISHEIEIIQSLIAEYEVYILPEQNVPFTTLRPISTLSQFLEARLTQPSLRAEDVEVKLSEQSLSPRNFIIIDHALYHEMIARYVEFKRYKVLDNALLELMELKKMKPDRMLLGETNGINLLDPATKENIVRSISSAKIKTLVTDEKTIGISLPVIPLVETIKLQETRNNSFLKENLSLLNNKSVLIEHNRQDVEKDLTIDLTGPAESKATLKSLSIKATSSIRDVSFLNIKTSELKIVARDVKEIILNPACEIERLTLQLDTLKDMMLSSTIKSFSLTFNRATSSGIKTIDLANQKMLEELHLSASVQSCIRRIEGVNPNLKVLSLHRLVMLEEEVDTTPFIHLQKLKIIATKVNLEKLSNTIVDLSLNEIEILNNNFLNSLDKIERLQLDTIQLHQLNLSSQTALKQLIITSFSVLNDIDLVANTALETLKFGHCANLRTIKNLAYSLTKLEIFECYKLEQLDLQHQTLLKELFIHGGGRIANLDLSQCHSLEILDIYTCSQMNKLDLTHCDKLKQLEINTLENLKELNLKNAELTSLTIHDCKMLNSLDLSYVPKLSTLNLRKMDLSIINLPANLKKLTLHSVNNTTSFQHANLKYLEELNHNDIQVGFIFSTTPLPSLKRLTLNDSNIADENFDLSGLNNLDELNISCAELSLSKWPKGHIKVVNIKTIKVTTADLTHVDVEEISISSDQQTYDRGTPTVIWPKENRIRKLVINCWGKTLDLSQFKDLEILIINDANIIESIILPKNSKLKYVKIGDCPNLKSCNLEDCKLLEKIHLNKVALETVDLSAQPYLLAAQIDMVANKPTTIKVHSCPLLRKLIIAAKEDLALEVSNTPRMHNLSVEGWKNIKIDTLNDSPYLNKLYISCLNINVLCKTILVGLPQTIDMTLYSVSANSPQQNAEDERNILSQKNSKNPTSIFSLRHAAHVDMQTGPPTAYQANGEFKLTMYSQKGVDRDNYRITTLSKVKYENGKLTFMDNISGLQPLGYIQKDNFDANVLSAQKALIDSDPDRTLSLFEGIFLANKYYPLPLMLPTAPLNLDLFTDPKGALSLFWHEEYKQHFFKVNPAFANQKLKILYNAKYSPVKIAEENAATEIYVVKTPLLPDELALKLRTKLNIPGSPVGFLFDSALGLAEKLARLQHYMTVEYQTEDIGVNFPDDADNICARILNHKGVCRHRSEDFFVCARLLCIPVQIKTNEEHAFVEVPYLLNGKVINKKVNLGGGERLDLTPLNVRDNSLGTATTSKSKAAPTIPLLTHAQPRSALQQYYDQQFYAIAQASQVSLLAQLWPKPDSRPPIIQIPANHTAFSVNKAILDQLSLQGFNPRNHIYIDKPQDFSFYLHPWKYSNGEFVAQPRGPLTDLIEKGGVLVINWSTFTAQEIAIYKSILEKEPTFKGLSVSKQLKVIGLASLGTESCSAFLSRTQPYSLSNNFFIAEPPKQAFPLNGAIEVDLFKCLAWREKLLGTEYTQSDVSRLVEGPLVEAIRFNKPLRIINAPEDKDFKLIIHHVLDERKLFYNNELLMVPDGFNIEFATKQHPITLPNVKVEPNASANKTLRYLGVHNLHECYERIVITNNKKSQFPSLLEAYNPVTDVFYITDFIPQQEWQRLLFEINTTYKNKSFVFHLAPFAEIEGVARSDLQLQQVTLKIGETIPPSATVITTNDPDFQSNQLAKAAKDPLIVDVSVLTRFNDLMYEIELKSQSGKSAQFNYIEKGVLKALTSASGRRVILNGELNPSLYQQLLPWLSGQKTFDNNGVTIPITGELIAVMPKSAREHLLLISETQKDLLPADYAKMIPENQQGNFQRILQFYELANKLPHSGLGRPSAPEINFQRLQQMLMTLEKPFPLHRHNPIKSVFHYDYPRYSDDYAYLNVMAKAIFLPKDDSDLREDKLIKLMARYDLTNFAEFKKHYWKVLNCFNGKILNSMLGANFKELNFSGTFPALNENEIKRLHKRILSIQAHHEQWKLQAIATRYRNDKQIEQLRAALADANHLVINIKGEAGVGKTNTIGTVLKEYHVGEKGIVNWLQTGGYLYLDEPNLAKPGTWDFLKGISRGTVFYKGVEYKIKPDQKIVTSFNPEHYPNRFYHRFLQEYGTTLFFAKYDDAYMRERILAPILNPLGLAKINYLDGILAAFHLINEFQPLLTVSTRDLENMAQRFSVLVASYKGRYPANQIVEQALLQAGIHEFSGSIKDAVERERFIVALEIKLNIKRLPVALPPVIHVTDTHRLTPEKAYLLDAIEQDLLMRNQQVAQIKALRSAQADKKISQAFPEPYYKYGILLEGESGVGKSSLYKAILKRNLDREISELKKSIPDQTSQAFLSAVTEINKRWQYYEITAGDPTASATLTKAAHEGAWVILDEVNLDKALEELLNQLLTGKDMEGKLLTNPGFRVLSSQNPGNYAGREPLSPAMLNRFHLLHMNTFSDKELTAIADSYLPGQGEVVVDSFREVEKKYQHSINTRTFFESLATLKPAPVQQKPLSPEEAEGKKYYNEFWGEVSKNIPLQQIIDKYKKHKESIIKFVDSFDEPIRLKIYNEILDGKNSLGQLMHTRTGRVPLSVSKEAVLIDVQKKRDVLHNKLSVVVGKKP